MDSIHDQLRASAKVCRQLFETDQPFEVFHGRSGGNRYGRTVAYYQQLIELIDKLQPGQTIVITRAAPKQEFDGDFTYKFNGGPEHKIDMTESLATLSGYYDEKFAQAEQDIRRIAENKGVAIIDAFKKGPDLSHLFEQTDQFAKKLTGFAEMNRALLDESQKVRIDKFNQTVECARTIIDAFELKTPVKGSRRGRNIKPDKSKKARYS